MTDNNRDELDDETKDLVDEIDEQLETSGTANEGSNPYPSDGQKAPPIQGNSTSSGGTASDSVAAMIVLTIKAVLKFPMAVLSKLPKKTRIYQAMIKAGYQAMLKNTSANVIVNTIYGDREIVPRPAEIDDKTGKVRTVNGEEWSLPDGVQTYHMGNSRIMWGVADAHELVSPVGARTAEKIDVDDAVYVTNQRRQQQAHAVAAGTGGQQARADGGITPSGFNAHSLNLWDGEPFEDVLVNWANTNPDADGMIVSLEKHYELQHSQAGAEEMKKQEDRGRLAERFNGDKRTALIYVALLLGGIVLGMFGPSLATSIAGGDGGAGTSISLFITPLLG